MECDFDTLLRDAQQMRSTGAQTEDILAYLREKGCYKLQSIKILRAVDRISLGEAKKCVHLSRTWADARDADDALHAVAERALKAPDPSIRR